MFWRNKRKIDFSWLSSDSRHSLKITLKCRESLNSCLFSTKPWLTRGTHELAPLSLDWLTDRSRSEGRVESTLSILDFTDAVFKAWCCLFNSSVEFSPATMNVLCAGFFDIAQHPSPTARLSPLYWMQHQRSFFCRSGQKRQEECNQWVRIINSHPQYLPLPDVSSHPARIEERE